MPLLLSLLAAAAIAAAAAPLPAAAIHSMSVVQPGEFTSRLSYASNLPYLPWWPDPGGFLDGLPSYPQLDALACAPDYLARCPGGVQLSPPGSEAAHCVPYAAAPFVLAAGYSPPLPPASRGAPLDLPAVPGSPAVLARLFSEAGGMEAVVGPLRPTADAISAAGVWDFKTRQKLGDAAVVTSPPALHAAFSILHEGMRGEHAERLRYGAYYPSSMDETNLLAFVTVPRMYFGLGFDPDPETRHAAAARLASYLNTHGPGSANVSLSSAMWVDDGFTLDAHFADAARRPHGASLAVVEYGNRGAVQDEIDAWAEGRAAAAAGRAAPPDGPAAAPRWEMTGIGAAYRTWAAPPDGPAAAPRLPPGDAPPLVPLRDPYASPASSTAPVASSTASVAAFDARWEVPFGHGGQGPQHGTMHASGLFGYAHSHATQVVRLPYEGGRFSMIVMLPDDRGWASHREYPVYPGQIEQWLGEMEPTHLEVVMPEFGVEYAVQGTTWLGPLRFMPGGVPDGFQCIGHPSANFQDRYDRGLVSVDAVGTRAAHAVQAALVYGPGVWGGAGAEPPPLRGTQPAWAEPDLPRFSVDRPFMFAIYDEPAGMILFLGQVPADVFRP